MCCNGPDIRARDISAGNFLTAAAASGLGRAQLNFFATDALSEPIIDNKVVAAYYSR